MNPQIFAAGMAAVGRYHPAPPEDPSAVPPVETDFASDAFPEQAFPPVEACAADYALRCRRGYAAMAKSRVVVTGLARNLAGVLPMTIARVERLCGLFADHRVVIYENDSADATKLILQRWAASNPRVHVALENHHDPRNPSTRCLARAERMARYRARCQEIVLDTGDNFDATIVLDLDVTGGFSLDGVANSFGHDDWDFIGSNGLVFRRQGLAVNALRQYDMWALRFDAGMTPIPTAGAGRHVYHRGEPLVPVTCCFGGLGIYRMEAFRQGRYGPSDCEHVTFHKSLIDGGHGRLFLNPSQILIYGRRNRFGDGVVRRALAAWSAVVGGAAEPWHFEATARVAKAA